MKYPIGACMPIRVEDCPLGKLKWILRESSPSQIKTAYYQTGEYQTQRPDWEV